MIIFEKKKLCDGQTQNKKVMLIDPLACRLGLKNYTINFSAFVWDSLMKNGLI